MIWKTIPKYPLYEANSEGHIRRICDYINPNVPGKILTERPGKKGYLYACVDDHTQQIAPLVCLAFHGEKPTPKHQAAHRNGVNTDNRPRNLSWLTQSENYQDQVRHGTHKKGERSPHAKLTEKIVMRIRTEFPVKSQAQLSRDFGITAQHVYQIVRRKCWTHV